MKKLIFLLLLALPFFGFSQAAYLMEFTNPNGSKVVFNLNDVRSCVAEGTGSYLFTRTGSGKTQVQESPATIALNSCGNIILFTVYSPANQFNTTKEMGVNPNYVVGVVSNTSGNGVLKMVTPTENFTTTSTYDAAVAELSICVSGGGGGGSLQNTYVGFGDGLNQLDGEAGFTYDAESNRLAVDTVKTKRISSKSGQLEILNDTKLNAYPNTRNDAGLPVNVLTTSATGVVESHPVGELFENDTLSSANAFLRGLSLSQDAASKIKITFIGDSRTEFRHTSNALRTILNEKYKIKGDLGQGYGGFGATEFLGSTKTSANATVVDNTGDALYSQSGKCTVINASAGFVKYTFTADTLNRFTNLKLYYLDNVGGATFDVLIDNVVVSSANSSGAKDVKVISITGLSDAVHSIECRQTSAGTLTLLDMHIERAVSSGIMVSAIGHGGYYAANYIPIQDNTLKYYFENPSDLYVVRLGVNDLNNSFTPASIADYIDTICIKVKSAVPNASFLLLGETDNSSVGQTAEELKSTNFFLSKKAEEKGYEFLSLYDLIPDWPTFYAQGLGDAIVHENAAGGVVIASYIRGKLMDGTTHIDISAQNDFWQDSTSSKIYTDYNVEVNGGLTIDQALTLRSQSGIGIGYSFFNSEGTLARSANRLYEVPVTGPSGISSSNIFTTSGTIAAGLGFSSYSNVYTNSAVHMKLSAATGSPIPIAGFCDALVIEGGARNGISFASNDATDVGLTWNSTSSGSFGSAYVLHNYSTGVLKLATNHPTGKIGFYTGSAALKGEFMANGDFKVVNLAGIGRRFVDVDATGILGIAPNQPIAALAAVGSTPNANAATITGSTLNLEPASATHKGVISLTQLKFPLKMTVVDGNTDVPGAGMQKNEVIRIPAAYNG